MAQKKTPLILSALLLIIVIGIGAAAFFIIHKDNDQQPAAPQTNQSQTSQETENPLGFDKNATQLMTLLAYGLSLIKNVVYQPPSLPNLVDVGGSQQMQSEAAQALQKLIKAASADNVSLRPVSGYRSYASQERVYNSYVQTDGQAKADTYSARPGHSEHQTGLAMDVGNGSGQCDLEICFGTTAGGKWVAEHAHTYGFVIRYLEDKTQVTGYQYEPWHLRYVGVDLANELRNNHQTMEEFFGLPAAPGY